MIALIDADSLIYKSLPKKSSPDTSYEDCLQELDSRIITILQAVNADGYILFLTEGRCFRYQDWKSSKNYKHSRNKDRMKPIFYALKEHLKQTHGAHVCKELEADDSVSYFKNNMKDSIICSPDKDVLLQNVGTHYDYNKLKFVEVSEEDATYFLFEQVGKGDSTDGIEGIRGVGDKTIEKWFKEVNDEHTYQAILIDKYIDNYGIHEGIIRFFETFTMVYLLKTEDDMLREIGFLPEMPIIQYLKEDVEEADDIEYF